MKNLLVGVVVGTALMVACSKEAVEQTVAEPRLMKTWETTCTSGAPLPFSKKSYFEFSGDQFTEVHTFFTNEDCTEPAAEIQGHGKFSLGEQVIAESGAKPLTLNYENAQMVALNDKGSEGLDLANFCDVDVWPVGQVVDLTSNSASFTCAAVTTAPSARYEIYRIDGDKLFVGNAGVGSRAKTEGDRPTQVDSNTPYVPSQRSLN